ncbi:MAG: tRNA (adenosine(37)-N6)-dimethylallyltransferase MiaA [Kiritimatiellae bacterium]|nr:tRNA (adenosine(37)-N6)-dimethylallyltransferase MiaA [Kiritimatiellia bacterium]
MPDIVATPLFTLAGPTAVGKTAVAHRLAEQLGARILSVDSMLVYRGMDVGTDKPPRAQLDAFGYAGVNLVDPSETCSVGRYLQSVRDPLADRRQPWIAVGGTGLYFRCLLQGLAPRPAAEPSARTEAEAVLRQSGLRGLQQLVRGAAPAAYAQLRDPENPRRLIRIYEIARQGGEATPPATWPAPPRLVGLWREKADLDRRIADRVRRMFSAGLLDEAAALRSRPGGLADAALQAIGYREALAVLDGRLTVEEAIAETIRRTRRLARRQMTWFRHQAKMEWVRVRPDATVESVADAVRRLWERDGPIATAI